MHKPTIENLAQVLSTVPLAGAVSKVLSDLQPVLREGVLAQHIQPIGLGIPKFELIGSGLLDQAARLTRFQDDWWQAAAKSLGNVNFGTIALPPDLLREFNAVATSIGACMQGLEGTFPAALTKGWNANLVTDVSEEMISTVPESGPEPTSYRRDQVPRSICVQNQTRIAIYYQFLCWWLGVIAQEPVREITKEAYGFLLLLWTLASASLAPPPAAPRPPSVPAHVVPTEQTCLGLPSLVSADIVVDSGASGQDSVNSTRSRHTGSEARE